MCVRNIFRNWALKTKKKELDSFLVSLKGMDGDELGGLVAISTHLKNGLESKGHIMKDPINYIVLNPGFAGDLSREIIYLQKGGNFPHAGAIMIWLHTFRAAIHPELRLAARLMWRELARGFPYVQEQRINLFSVANIVLDVRYFDEFPIGFTPPEEN